MLQVVQGALRGKIRLRRAPSRPELLHQLQQVQNVLLENVSSLSSSLERELSADYGKFS
jgi:hypothetical protein